MDKYDIEDLKRYLGTRMWGSVESQALFVAKMFNGTLAEVVRMTDWRGVE